MILKDICEVNWGNTKLTKSSYIENGRFLAVSAAGCDGKIDHYEHKSDVSVLSAIGAQCGRMFFPNTKFTAIKNTITLTPKKNVLGKYIFYLFNSINLPKRGAGQPFISKGDIEKFVIPQIPLLTKQQQIVEKLDAIFAEIDKAVAAAEANAKNIEALFQSYLNKIYDIKENLTKLKDCTKIKPPKSEIKILKGNTPVSFIPMESLGVNNKFIISKQSKELEIVKGSYTYFKEDDILLAKITPCFENGKLGIANNLENGIGFGSSEYIVFRVNQNLDKEWLYYFLNRESFRRLGSKHMSGSVGHKRITKEFIEETLIPLIPIAHQKKLVSNIDNLFLQSQRLKKASQNKISELFLLKNSILKQAFNGELVKAA